MANMDPQGQSLDMTTTTRQPAAQRWRRLALPVLLPLAVLLFALLLPPRSLWDKSNLVGYAICHQIDAHSYQPGGVALPLCARCTGTFLGALAGLATMALLGRGRAAALPPARVLFLLLLFVMAWGLDGLNSYMSFFSGLPHLYEPQNLLRLITGTLTGLAMSILLLPVVNFTLWREPQAVPAVPGVRALLPLLAAGAAAVVVVHANVAALRVPIALLETLGVLGMLSLINGTILVIILRRERRAAGWRDALPFYLWGAVMSLAEIGAIDLLRAWLETMVAVPR